MKLKLVIRFNQLVIETLELEPGTYEVGRSLDAHVHINHPSLHRRQGQIYFSENQWFYQDYSTQKVSALDQSPISLSSEIDIAPEGVTQEEELTPVVSKHLLFKSDQKKKIIYGFVLSLGLILGGVFTYLYLRSQLRHSDPNVLLSQVRHQIVEFEKIRNADAMKDYEELGQFKADEFRDRFGFCTGFMVAPNVVLTASHCLWGSDFLEIQDDFVVRAFDDKPFKPKRVLGFDPVRDYLFIEMEGMESYGHLDMATDYKVGQTVYTLGNAHGQGIAIREGILTSETPDINDPSIRYIRYSAGASPGNSGGPLLDINGRIVALVFAATTAENYNLGTSSKDLKMGMQQFVDNRKDKTVSVVLRKLFNFNPYGFLQRQNLPYLAEYNEYPELVQKVNDLSLTFPLPIPFSELSEKILTEVQTKSITAIAGIEEALRAKQELVWDWESFASPKTPVILPSQMDMSQNNFFLNNKRFYMKLTGFLDGPTKKDFRLFIEQFDKEKKFDFQAYGMNTEIEPVVAPAETTEPLHYAPRNVNKAKKNIEDLLQGALYSQFWLQTKLDDPQLFERFVKVYLNGEGVLSSTYSPFIRPQAFKNFTIEKLDKTPDKLLVKDGSGREWQRFHTKIFDQIHFYVYCLALPEGVSCTARVMPADNEFRLNLLESNFREHILSHYLENPYFWKPTALQSFMSLPASKALSSFKGVQLLAAGPAPRLKLEGFNLEVQLPAEAQSIRPLTGLYYAGPGKTSWRGFGVEWLSEKGKNEMCGMGVEPIGSQSIFILNFLRDSLKRLKIKDDIKQSDIPKLWTEKITTAAGEKLQLYGFCAPLVENPMEIGYYFADFKKAKPYAGTFKVLK